MAEEKEDQELAAIKTVLGALGPLEPEARNNVIDYVFRRLKITAPNFEAPTQPAALPTASEPAAPLKPAGEPSPNRLVDLRSLQEQKQPKSAIQMVTLLAYYLANLAPKAERRDYIVPEDIKKYFPQANFELPTGALAQTLVNAKNAGYLDVIGNGQYRLNSVGHNLVTHRLPQGAGSSPRRSTRRAKKGAKEAAKMPKVKT